MPPATLLMTDKTAEIANVPVDRVIKLNVDGAGYYRVQYDAASWKQLLNQFPKFERSGPRQSSQRRVGFCAGESRAAFTLF